jgi:hypothetical protein
MSSLRLALKLSMEDGAAPAPAPAAEPKEKPVQKRKRSESTASLKGEGVIEKDPGPAKKKDSSAATKDAPKKKSSSEKSSSSASEKKGGEGKSKSDGTKKKDGTTSLDGASKKEKIEKSEKRQDSDKKEAEGKDKESQPKKKKKEKEKDSVKTESAGHGNGSTAQEGVEVKEPVRSHKKKDTPKEKGKKSDGDEMDVEDDGGDDDDEVKDEEESRDDEVFVPRYQSSRAAAQVAKDKLSAKGFKASINEEYAPTSTKPRTPKATPKVPSQWVQCDKCTKWRSIPGNVDMDTLPEQWYCSMNKWDSSRRSCSVKEQEATADGGDDAAAEGNGEMDEDGNQDLAAVDDAYTIGSTGGHTKSETKRRGGGARGSAEGEALVDVEKVNWVQCNRCSKWRKAPLSVDPDSLPDVWHCAMNHWAPHMAKCSIKEEEDDEPDPLLANGTGTFGMGGAFGTGIGGPGSGGGSGYKSRRQAGTGTPATGSSSVKKKVVQWVQCERKNCKKWRKLPGHVDLSTLPEKWYCEMNQWDLDRANCDVPDDSDEEQEAKTNISSQLISGNTKGPSALSYRRIIFGTDGKIRPVYNEKNKNGYGIFSYSESRRHAERHGNTEENVEPISRLSYWWASVYDEEGAIKQRIEAARKPATGTGRGGGRHLNKEKTTSDAGGGDKESMSETAQSQEQSGTSPSSSSDKGTPEEAATEEEKASKKNKEKETTTTTTSSSSSNGVGDNEQKHPRRGTELPASHLLHMARKMGGWDVSGMGRPHPMKFLKATGQGQGKTASFIRKERAACTITRSCLTGAGPVKHIPLHEVMRMVDTAFFHSAELESVRRSMNMHTLKGALKQLEIQGEVDMTFSDGQVCVTLSPTYRGKATDSVALKWKGGGPLKMRKLNKTK